MDICAVICTCGGRRTLEAAVASLVEQTLDAERYEIIVVLNRNSESHLRKLEAALAAVAAPRKAALHIISEPEPGLSRARNRGIAATRAKYIAFIDDDAQADPDWLENILTCFGRNERIAAVGGPILPLWESPPPSWIRPPMYTYFSCKDFGVSVRHLGVGEYFFGTNMAFTHEVLLKCGGFLASLGRKGGSLLSNEEWPVFRAIDDMCFLKLASPEVRVRHFVPRERMTRRFFIRRLWWQGVSNTIYHLKFEGRSKTWIARQAIRDFRRYYTMLPHMLQHGHATRHLAFFNLFRWAGIAHVLTKHLLQPGNCGACPMVTN